MYSNTAAFASARVRNRASWTRSVLSEAKKLSMGALSKQLPRRLIDGWMPCRSSTARYGPEAYCTPRTPFCVSSGDRALVDLASALADQREQLARDVALQAADRLELGMALGDALGHVGLGSRIRPKPADGDDVQRAVGGPVTPSVEAMAGRLARGGGHGADPAQPREAGFRSQALRIVACRQEELRGRAMADRVPGHKGGRELVDDRADHRVEVGYLVVQLE